MHIKFTTRGRGSAKKAADYLLRERDHKGDVRAEVKVLSGNPEQVANVADSLSFKYKYSSAVIAWHPDDKPSELQILEAVHEFEASAFAGVDEQNRCFSAVLHRDDDGTPHVHIISARVDLGTGKSFNVAPPGWEKTYDPVRDYLNEKYSWKSPDTSLDLENARLLSILNNDQKRDPNIDDKLEITRLIVAAIDDGTINDRSDIIDALKNAGIQVTRQTKRSISVSVDGKKMRLKGAVYEQDFSAAKLTAAEKSTAKGRDYKRLDSLRKQVEYTRSVRRDYNIKRYKARDVNTGGDNDIAFYGADRSLRQSASAKKPELAKRKRSRRTKLRRKNMRQSRSGATIQSGKQDLHDSDTESLERKKTEITQKQKEFEMGNDERKIEELNEIVGKLMSADRLRVARANEYYKRYVDPDAKWFKNLSLNTLFYEDGGQWFFKNKKPAQVAFEDQGEKLVARTIESGAMKAMAQAALAKFGNEYTVNGSEEFRREAWIQGSLHGAKVNGFEPGLDDWELLIKRANKYKDNHDMTITIHSDVMAEINKVTRRENGLITVIRNNEMTSTGSSSADEILNNITPAPAPPLAQGFTSRHGGSFTSQEEADAYDEYYRNESSTWREELDDSSLDVHHEDDLEQVIQHEHHTLRDEYERELEQEVGPADDIQAEINKLESGPITFEEMLRDRELIHARNAQEAHENLENRIEILSNEIERDEIEVSEIAETFRNAKARISMLEANNDDFVAKARDEVIPAECKQMLSDKRNEIKLLESEDRKWHDVLNSKDKRIKQLKQSLNDIEAGVNEQFGESIKLREQELREQRKKAIEDAREQAEQAESILNTKKEELETKREKMTQAMEEQDELGMNNVQKKNRARTLTR